MTQMRTVALFVLLLPLANVSTAQDLDVGDLSETFEAIFNRIFIDQFSLSPGEHANHYRPAADLAADQLAPALNSLIASNVASFPLSSTVAGITFDFQEGQPVRRVESLGPIFAESAATLGERNVAIGFNATHLSLNRFRDVSLDDLQFTFFHEDVGEIGILGDVPSETDLVRTRLDLDLDATILAFYATYGAAPNLDVGIAIPFVSVNLSGSTTAEVDSYTLLALDVALHYFEGTATNPILTTAVPYEERARGVGDIALRLKYRLPLTGPTNVATLLDVRLPTGNEEDFLGTGSTSARVLLIGSRSYGAFNPHLNLGYDYRGADLDSDEFEFALGFDQQLSQTVTMAIDVLGELDLNSDEAIRLLPGQETIAFRSPRDPTAATMRTFPRSNVPDKDYDHTLRAALGARWAPTLRFQLLANLLVPLNNSGLYSTIVPTFGISLIP